MRSENFEKMRLIWVPGMTKVMLVLSRATLCRFEVFVGPLHMFSRRSHWETLSCHYSHWVRYPEGLIQCDINGRNRCVS